MVKIRHLFITMLLAIFLIGCRPDPASSPRVLDLVTTTSTYDTGLVTLLLDRFFGETGIRIEVQSVGTGQALRMGELGDVDLILAHAPELEETFMEEGYGALRYPVMYNDFVIVGPSDDPAGIMNAGSAVDAFNRIASAQVPFASRGDNSGTHFREQKLWESAGLDPTGETTWYASLGQGQAAMLRYAYETGSYALTDRGTYLSQQAENPGLVILYGGKSAAENSDQTLLNPYHIILVNSDLHERVNVEDGKRFMDWLISIPVQEMIRDFGVDKYSVPLFIPDSDPWRASGA